MGDWMDVAGNNNWANLLRPLKNNLRQRLIQCGDRVQVIYDSIDTNGLPKYAKGELFSEVGPEKGKPSKLYEVTEYIYAWIDVPSLTEFIIKDQSTWIGFVAVTTSAGEAALGRKDILICWRGTFSAAEWNNNFMTGQIQPSVIFSNKNNVNVHRGFYSIYTSSKPDSTYSKKSARDQVRDAVTKLVDQYKNDTVTITVTGHSLGAALATLNAADIVSNGYHKTTRSPTKEFMVTAFVFASPLVGDDGFRDAFVKLGRNLKLLRIGHAYDFVPLVPLGSAYAVVGIELWFLPNGSPLTLPIILTPGMKTKYHSLKNYLEELALDRSGRSEAPINLAVRELSNGEWELYQK